MRFILNRFNFYNFKILEKNKTKGLFFNKLLLGDRGLIFFKTFFFYSFFFKYFSFSIKYSFFFQFLRFSYYRFSFIVGL
jgi:hypothetical protein